MHVCWNVITPPENTMKNLVTAFLFIATVLAREYKEYDHLDCIGNDIHQVEAREVDSLPNLYWTA